MVGNKKFNEIPGFCLRKGLEPLIPLYLEGLLHGSAQTRELAAQAFGDLIDLTPQQALSPYVIRMTGPLIRIVGDRFPAPVKTAILHTLGLLIAKTSKYLKPFLPQLQTTFQKALVDPTEEVREKAAAGLAGLVPESRRIDPLIAELTNNVKSQDSPGIKTSMLNALEQILRQPDVGTKITPTVLTTTQKTLVDFIEDDRDAVRRLAARTLGVSAQYLPDKELSTFLNDTLLKESENWLERDGRLIALAQTVRTSYKKLDGKQQGYVVKFTLDHLSDDNVTVKQSAVETSGVLLQGVGERNDAESEIGRAVQQECRDRSRMPSSA
eukprot:TRINITY_DN21042_c0_g1_i1.p1 TRINITY_DN21042_c0_g1~~TRINITY_DN21042_c0_g1_i1.p1  ORF type:complete len:325 (+),score=62.61 TRINITY_DN21042_c0_g1_i1:134-1108(+)